ncbi:MAG: DUF3604 domain-containing protein [Pseudomonadales bacterium]|nr:DUF3604 domain-containing protein [Pseudomonadales bacterium]
MIVRFSGFRIAAHCGLLLCAVLAGPAFAAQDSHCDYFEAGVKHVYWGDLHVHTGFSLDAWGYGTVATPREAYAFARGAPIELPGGHTVKLDRPLDFMAVTDHAEWFDLMYACTDPLWKEDPYCTVLTTRNTAATGTEVFAEYVVPTITKADPRQTSLCQGDPALCANGSMHQWQRIQRQAHDANAPCTFTSFAAYEWSATPDFSHTHRNVIFGSEQVSREAIDYLRFPTPERMWRELDRQCRAEDGCDVVVIPHNTNMGDGKSFDVETEPADALALRARFERLIEIHQEKGNSECLPVFGTTDEDCGFEVILNRSSRPTPAAEFSEAEWERMRGSYVRRLLLRGLYSYAESGVNPLQLGIIGSTDNHAAAGGFVEEDQWLGSVFGIGDIERTMARQTWNPGGMVGVWAEENTRSSVFAALQRREVFATSGPRIKVRISASPNPLSCDNGATGDMVPMGGKLAGGIGAAYFLIEAQYDRIPLQRIELIKGELRGGELIEEVVPVWQADDGGLDVCGTWRDADFDPTAPAFWYARVQEAPTPRWTAARCIAADRCDDFPEARRAIRERAWTSPIWYLP